MIHFTKNIRVILVHAYYGGNGKLQSEAESFCRSSVVVPHDHVIKTKLLNANVKDPADRARKFGPVKQPQCVTDVLCAKPYTTFEMPLTTQLAGTADF